MKLSRAEWAILAMVVGFVLFCGGYFAGSHSFAQPFTVTAERQAEQVPPAQTALPRRTPPLPALPAATAAVTDAPALIVDINTADAPALQTLPGIGEKRAEDIVAYREVHGPFRRPEDLTDVPGIGQGTLGGLLSFITASQPPA